MWAVRSRGSSNGVFLFLLAVLGRSMADRIDFEVNEFSSIITDSHAYLHTLHIKGCALTVPV
jgi:thymidylate synthase